MIASCGRAQNGRQSILLTSTKWLHEKSPAAFQRRGGSYLFVTASPRSNLPNIRDNQGGLGWPSMHQRP